LDPNNHLTNYILAKYFRKTWPMFLRWKTSLQY